VITANQITLIRLFLTFPFIFLLVSSWGFENRIYIALIFLVLSATDFLDGFIARKKNQISQIGKFLDPLADKILVCSVLLALLKINIISLWPAIIIVAREIIISSVRGVSLVYAPEILEARFLGKLKTFFQICALFLAISQFYNHAVILWFAAILSVISGFDYLAKVIGKIRQKVV
jgi:CDP-diacylglycerol--glycerol-3-phosphate 3-phosphatidyltransferase